MRKKGREAEEGEREAGRQGGRQGGREWEGEREKERDGCTKYVSIFGDSLSILCDLCDLCSGGIE